MCFGESTQRMDEYDWIMDEWFQNKFDELLDECMEFDCRWIDTMMNGKINGNMSFKWINE